MWKLLRNVALLALLLTGGLKLLLEYAARQEAARASAQLAPYAQLRYDGISAGINGSVELTNVSITPVGHARESYTAERIALKTPSPFWLLQRWVTGDNTLPPTLGIDIVGPRLPTTASLAILDGWISPTSLVPFETQGCGVVSRFSVADYQRMGLNPGKPSEHIDLRYDADQLTLNARIAMLVPGLSSIVLQTEVQHFDPKTATTADGMRKLHVSQFALDYTDQDYLQRRNKFCAQLAGVDAPLFPEQHVAAVLAFLQKHQIDPGSELLKMYRTLVSSGGRIAVMSLPKATFKLAEAPNLAPEELLRQLNVTARYNDAPPVMFRLAFAAAPDDANVAGATSVPANATASVVDPPKPAADPPAAIATALTAKTPDPPLPSTSVVVSTPPPAKAAIAASDNKTPVASDRIDKHTIREPLFPSDPQKSPIVVAHPKPADNVASTDTNPEDVAPSTPAPPPGSTLALVWRPEIQRLPPPAPAKHDYDIIDFGGLRANVGKHVRLIIEGGKQVEGAVVSVDNTTVEMRVRVIGSGTAQLQIQRAAIKEIQVPHRVGAG